VTLLVPRPEAPFLSFALRIRDVSRHAEGLGTQIPVVREKDLYHGTIMTLLDVPIDPGHRVKVRIYALEPFDELHRAGRVVIFRQNNHVAEALVYRLTRNCAGSACAGEPYYAEVDLRPGAAGARVNVYIEPPLDATTWAFATVTNNATQQVTIVTPNGRGGEP
jgi:hypothetical protein